MKEKNREKNLVGVLEEENKVVLSPETAEVEVVELTKEVGNYQNITGGNLLFKGQVIKNQEFFVAEKEEALFLLEKKYVREINFNKR